MNSNGTTYQNGRFVNVDEEHNNILAAIKLDVFRNFYLIKHKDKYQDNNLNALIELFQCRYEE